MSEEIKIDGNSTKPEIMEFLAAAEWNTRFDVPKNVNFSRSGKEVSCETIIQEIFHWNNIPGIFPADVFYKIIPPPAPKQYRPYTLEELLQIFLSEPCRMFRSLTTGFVGKIEGINPSKENFLIAENEKISTKKFLDHCYWYNPETKEFDIPCGVEVTE